MATAAPGEAPPAVLAGGGLVLPERYRPRGERVVAGTATYTVRLSRSGPGERL